MEKGFTGQSCSIVFLSRPVLHLFLHHFEGCEEEYGHGPHFMMQSDITRIIDAEMSIWIRIPVAFEVNYEAVL